MKKLRILFMGTPEFAVYILDEILKAEHTVVGVVTAPDRPAGRGQRVHSSAVKKFAEKKNLPIYQPSNLKSPEFQKELQDINPDIAVVVAFRMLPKMVWNFPAYGTFNLHASLLPDYRGAAPINWAIINGEEKTGVTTFFLDEKIDTGKIILQEEVKIESDDDAGSLHDKLMIKGADLVNQTLKLIAEKNIETQPQSSPAEGKTAPKLDSKNTRIDWSKTPEEINNLVRGLNPY
ncbi:MAG TPA: methionyl-tRNA formyltransferase, partial [Flavobacteriaceae bacterium]|nr:methionyl-tRNA formyltransferase [Flavobacteriaceae bacterium]